MSDSILNKKPEELKESDIIYDWNSVEKTGPLTRKKVRFFCETLRDGIQSPSVVDPKIDDKVKLVQLASDIGIHHIDIGLPGAGPRAVEDVTRLATYIRDSKLPIKPACAARTHLNDIRPIVEISQKVGIEIEVMSFIGCSPIRLYAEGWDLDQMVKRSAEAISFAAKNNLPCTYVTEDTTRSRPEVLDKLFRNAIDNGAHRLCICDTVGFSTPDGIRNIIKFTRNVLEAMGVADRVGIDWHGHNDRGLGVTNTIHAIEFGADRVHGTALGMGERVGNAQMELILLNLKLLGLLDGQDLTHLLEYCNVAAQAVGWQVPINYPLVGRDAFRTATGVHAAAIIKAEAKGNAWLADRIYSGVPAGMFGRRQEICIGYMSGASNVNYWLRQRKMEPSKELVDAILAKAKGTDHILSDEEILAVVEQHGR